MADIYITGMSHTDAIASALKSYDGPLSFEIDRLNPKVDSESFTGGRPNPGYFKPKLQAKLVVFNLWGNWYNTLGIAEHTERFDFIYPGFDETVDESRRIIPFHQIRRTMNNNVRYRIGVAKVLRPLTNSKVLMMEPPPPNETEHIQAFPRVFKDVIDATGVTPAPIRLKLWKLQSQIYEDLARENDMDFFPFLPEAITPSGFLAPDFRYRDPTHANAKYGALVVSRLVQIHGAIQ